MDKTYRVAIHFLYITEVEATNEREALSEARDKLNTGAHPDETNTEVEELC